MTYLVLAPVNAFVGGCCLIAYLFSPEANLGGLAFGIINVACAIAVTIINIKEAE